MHTIRKLPFYFNVILLLLFNTYNPQAYLSLLFGRRSRIKLRNGLKFYISQPMDALVIAETLLLDVYKSDHIANPKIVADVGAGFGDYSIFMAHKFPKSKVFAFEPDPRQFELLRANIQANGLSNIDSFNVAVGNGESFQLNIANTKGMSSAIEVAQQKSNGEITVPCCQLQSVTGNTVDVLKVDCEGMEIEVLKSLTTEVIRRTGFIALEYHNHLVPGEDSQLSQMLTELDFECIRKPDKYNRDLGFVYAANQKFSIA